MSVVVPVYLNAGTLEKLSQAIFDELGEQLQQIVFVDDNSPDGSGKVLEQLARENPAVTVVSHVERRGQQIAVLSGIRAAVGEILVVMDADLQDPPSAIPGLVNALDTHDVVFATRIGMHQPLPRMFTSRLFKRMISQLAGVPPNAGMFVAFRSDTVKDLHERWNRFYLVAALGLAAQSVGQIPVERRRREHGTSAYRGIDRSKLAAMTIIWTLQERRARKSLRSRPRPSSL